jgi:DNA ligase (NAD+)
MYTRIIETHDLYKNFFEGISMKSDEIVKLLNEARDAYYNSDTPVMTDAEFDELEEKLRAVDPENKYFSYVGSESSSSDKIKHRIPMLSMGKAKTMGDVITWIKRLGLKDGERFIIEPKIDGLSATCRYKDGMLMYVATRGDGEYGQDITHIAEYVEDIPSAVSFTMDDIEVRGELYLPRGTGFDTGGRPLRNNCVGLINRKENRGDLKYVRFAVYQITGIDLNTSESSRIDLLGKNGFNAVAYSLATNAGEIESFYSSYMRNLRSEWEYETDGLIVSVDDRKLFEEIDSRWILDHHHHYAIALKPPAEFRETVLNDVAWQVSRQGNLVPVALFEPVIIGGAKLGRATLNNFENVRKLKIEKGDTLIVQRANDVIPFVYGNKSSAGRDSFSGEIIAKECPSCGSHPVPSGVHLKCVNPECREQIIQRIIYWVKNCSIENVAEASIRKLFDLGRIKRIKDLYELTAKDFEGIEGFAEKKIMNFITEVRASKKMTPAELISRLGIPLVQKKSLVKMGIYTIRGFLDFNDDTYVIGKNIIEWKSDESNLGLLNELLEVLDLVDEQKKESSGKVCMTGKGPGKRNDLIKIIEESGYEYSPSVTKDLAILICDDVSGKSSKLDNARKNGIKLMNYEEFFGDKIIDMKE